MYLGAMQCKDIYKRYSWQKGQRIETISKVAVALNFVN